MVAESETQPQSPFADLGADFDSMLKSCLVSHKRVSHRPVDVAQVLPSIAETQTEEKERNAKKEKKKRKRRNAMEMTGFNLSLFPRYKTPVEDVIQEFDDEPTTSTQEYSFSVEDELREYELLYKYADDDDVVDSYDQMLIDSDIYVRTHKDSALYDNSRHNDERLRPKRKNKVMKAHKQVKSHHCRSIRNNNGKHLYVKHRVFKRVRFEERTLYYIPGPKKEVAVTSNAESTPTTKKSRYAAKIVIPPPVKYALQPTNIPNELNDIDLIQFLIDCQNRDLTPEDYELLLRLDDSVAPKTVPKSALHQLKSDTVKESQYGELCMICLEPYMMEQVLKYLPCNHGFHDKCIDMWLSNSSMNCPLDGLPIET